MASASPVEVQRCQWSWAWKDRSEDARKEGELACRGAQLLPGLAAIL